MPKSLAVLALLTFLAAPAAAHVTLSATGPAEVQVGVPFTIDAEVRALCAVVLGEYQSAGETELYFGLPPGHAAYFANHTGPAAAPPFPWTVEQCSLDPAEQGNAVGVGTLTLQVTAAAPAFTTLNLSVVAYGDDPAVPEGGDPAVVPIKVAYHGAGKLTAKQAAPGHGHGAGHGTPAIELLLNYTVNAPSLLTIEATSSTGEVHEIDAVAVDPPAFDNKSFAELRLPVSFEAPANWSSADLSFTAFLAPVVGGSKVPVGSATLTLANDGAGGSGDEHEGHDHEDEAAEESPAPVFALLALGLLAFAARRR